MRSTLAPLSALLLALPVAAQANRFAITESYDPASPIALGFSPADIVVVNSTMAGGGGVQWRPGDLGLPPTANVDAFSDGTDFFPPVGPAMLVPPANCGFIVVEDTVDATSIGPPGSLVNSESTGNGAASDTFVVRWFGAPVGIVSHGSDALGVSALPLETDLDALAWRQRQRFPVFLSVDPPTATALGMSPGTIYIVAALGGPPVPFFTETQLGLVAGDDIDALAVNARFGLPASPIGTAVFSLSRSSPSVGPTGGLATTTAAGLAVTGAGGVALPWAFPLNLVLDPAADNLNGVRITDPLDLDVCDGSIDNPITGFPHRTLLVDGSGGDLGGVVDVEVGTPFTVSVAPLGLDPWIAFARIGVPCDFEFLSIPELPTELAVSPAFSVSTLIGVGPLTLPPLSFPAAVDIAIQAIVVEPGGAETSNMVVARIN